MCLSARADPVMYTVERTLPVGSIPPGTNLLVLGPPMTGKYDLVCEIVADGLERGEGGLVVSTQNDAGRVSDDLARYVDGDPAGPVGVVDCVSKERGVDTPRRQGVRYVSSPADLTGIGMEASELLEGFNADVDRTRGAIHSVSQLLMYTDVKTVFRFLHVMTGRFDAANALGLSIMDSESHDDQTLQTIKQLFDGLVETREGESGREFRVRGLGERTDWQPQ